MPNCFDTYHPSIPALYFAAVLVLVMASLQPVLVAIALVSGFAYSSRLRGWRSSLKTAAWQLPLLLIIVVANPIFSAQGSTELFRIGVHPIFLESFAYGLCMGALLISVMLWFSNAAQVMSSDKLMSLAGGRAPVLSLMATMTLRLVPQFVRRGSEIASVQQACTVAQTPALQGRLRQATVLMGWGMEDSLDTADAMKARAWGTAQKRSSYSRVSFRARDAVTLLLMLALVALAAAGDVILCGSSTIYPAISISASWWLYIPGTVLMLLPLAMELVDALRWRMR